MEGTSDITYDFSSRDANTYNKMRVERQILFKPLHVEENGRKNTKNTIFKKLKVHIVAYYKSWVKILICINESINLQYRGKR